MRIRLNSTVVRVRHIGEGASQAVEIAYAESGKLKSVRAKHCVLACWHSVIPYICPELPEAQQAALHLATKVPLLYTNVLIRNWTAFQKLGVASIHAPGELSHRVRPRHAGERRRLQVLNFAGGADPRHDVEDAMQPRARPPTSKGRPRGAARHDLRSHRAQHPRSTGPGPRPRRIRSHPRHSGDHGQPLGARLRLPVQLALGPVLARGQAERTALPGGRQTHGRIAIANSDAAAYAYTDAAIDQAHRAVGELLKG